jgi:hypothetical protein
MDPKLAMLFLLIGIVIGLSHLSHEAMTKIKQEFDRQRWRGIVPRSRKS